MARQCLTPELLKLFKGMSSSFLDSPVFEPVRSSLFLRAHGVDQFDLLIRLRLMGVIRLYQEDVPVKKWPRPALDLHPSPEGK